MTNAKETRKTSISIIRECFFEKDVLSVNDLMEMTALSHGALVAGVKRLEEDGEIMLYAKRSESVGRKTHLYTLNPDSFHALMIFIGRSESNSAIRYHTALCDLAGKFHDENTFDSDTYDLKDLRNVIESEIKQHPQAHMVLISSPGVCMNGVIRNRPYFEADAGALITAHNLSWAVENDVNTACIGFHSRMKQYDDMAFVYQARADVFGCGMIIHGSLYNGFAHAAGELRYFPFMRYAKEKSAKELLREQILSVAALMNPQCIGYYSNDVQDEIELNNEMPSEAQPEIVRVSDFDELQKLGLYAVMKQRVIEQRGGQR